MHPRLRELLDQIDGKKSEITNLANAGNLEEAKAKKQELVDLQERFNILKDVLDPEGDGSVPAETAINTITVSTGEEDAVHEFANAARMRFRNMNSEGTPADGGYTVPQDIQTRINKFREAKFSLQTLVASESVTAPSGRRTYQTKKQHTGFSSVEEAGKIGAVAGPQFQPVSYAIKKYAGYLPVTNELLADSDANITNTLIEWLGEEDVATRNAIVLAQIAKKDQEELDGLDGIKKALNVTLGQAYSGTSAIVTNDDGLNYLDTLKDTTGRYLLQPDINPDNPFSMTLAVGARRVPVVVVPNSALATKDSKIPFVVGDLKEYCRIFDRQSLTIMTSDTAAVGSGESALNAFEQDLTLFRGILRLDGEVIDADAIVNGYVSVSGSEDENGGQEGNS